MDSWNVLHFFHFTLMHTCLIISMATLNADIGLDKRTASISNSSSLERISTIEFSTVALGNRCHNSKSVRH